MAREIQYVNDETQLEITDNNVIQYKQSFLQTYRVLSAIDAKHDTEKSKRSAIDDNKALLKLLFEPRQLNTNSPIIMNYITNNGFINPTDINYTASTTANTLHSLIDFNKTYPLNIQGIQIVWNENPIFQYKLYDVLEAKDINAIKNDTIEEIKLLFNEAIQTIETTRTNFEKIDIQKKIRAMYDIQTDDDTKPNYVIDAIKLPKQFYNDLFIKSSNTIMSDLIDPASINNTYIGKEECVNYIYKIPLIIDNQGTSYIWYKLSDINKNRFNIAFTYEKNNQVSTFTPEFKEISFDSSKTISPSVSDITNYVMKTMKPKKNVFVKLVNYIDKHIFIKNKDYSPFFNWYIYALNNTLPRELKDNSNYLYSALIAFKTSGDQTRLFDTFALKNCFPSSKNYLVTLDGFLYDNALMTNSVDAIYNGFTSGEKYSLTTYHTKLDEEDKERIEEKKRIMKRIKREKTIKEINYLYDTIYYSSYQEQNLLNILNYITLSIKKIYNNKNRINFNIKHKKPNNVSSFIERVSGRVKRKINNLGINYITYQTINGEKSNSYPEYKIYFILLIHMYIQLLCIDLYCIYVGLQNIFSQPDDDKMIEAYYDFFNKTNIKNNNEIEKKIINIIEYYIILVTNQTSDTISDIDKIDTLLDIILEKNNYTQILKFEDEGTIIKQLTNIDKILSYENDDNNILYILKQKIQYTRFISKNYNFKFHNSLQIVNLFLDVSISFIINKELDTIHKIMKVLYSSNEELYSMYSTSMVGGIRSLRGHTRETKRITRQRKELQTKYNIDNLPSWAPEKITSFNYSISVSNKLNTIKHLTQQIENDIIQQIHGLKEDCKEFLIDLYIFKQFGVILDDIDLNKLNLTDTKIQITPDLQTTFNTIPKEEIQTYVEYTYFELNRKIEAIHSISIENDDGTINYIGERLFNRYMDNENNSLYKVLSLIKEDDLLDKVFPSIPTEPIQDIQTITDINTIMSGETTGIGEKRGYIETPITPSPTSETPLYIGQKRRRTGGGKKTKSHSKKSKALRKTKKIYSK